MPGADAIARSTIAALAADGPVLYPGTGDAAWAGQAGPFLNAFSAWAIVRERDIPGHLHRVARRLEPHGRYVLLVAAAGDGADASAADATTAAIVEASALHHARPDAADAGRDPPPWRFTPAGFAAAMDRLARLDLSPFDVEAVDMPAGDVAFRAVLRLARPPRVPPRRNAGPPVVMLQTADAQRYPALLAVTAPNLIEYCRRHGLAYESFVGLKRGCWPWQASFNRIVMLNELVDRGHDGWAVYLDADAYVRDMDFDLPAYLARHADRGVIVASSTMTDAPWDVNSGVVMVDCRHPAGRRLVRLWMAALDTLTPDALAARPDWCHPDDQDWLQTILRDDAQVAAALLTESAGLLNAPASTFVRQRQRTQFPDFESRLSAIAADVAETMRAAGVATGPFDDGRAAARLLHPVRSPAPDAPRLAEAPAPPPDPAAARVLIARWRPSPAPLQPRQAAFAALLDAGDADGLAQALATLGRSRIAEGSLGGTRQHERAATDPGFAAMRALRIRDGLLSLAELTGAIPVEDPDDGPWGGNARRAPAALFERVAARLGADLTPPAAIGAWLGIAAGGGTVLHQRMVEAIHAAWRLRDLLAMDDIGAGGGVLELGGGVGLTAFYAGRLGIAGHAVAAGPVDAVVQRHVLGRDPAAGGGPVAIVLCDDATALLPPGDAVRHLRAAMARGAHRMLGFGPDARADAAPAPFTAAALADAVGGWKCVGRARHGIRPGHVEQLYMRTS